MTGTGLVEVTNPSALYLGEPDRRPPRLGDPRRVEGTRPLLLEVQALTVRSSTERRAGRRSASTGRASRSSSRSSSGTAGSSLSGHDVFLNIAGGAESEEPAADLAVLAAVAGSVAGDGAAEGGTSSSARWDSSARSAP